MNVATMKSTTAHWISSATASSGPDALKLWAAMRHLGRAGYRRIVERQLELTRHLAAEIGRLDDYTLVGDVQTAVCCIRFLPASVRDASPESQDALQTALQQRIERGGAAWLATTVLGGRRTLRINVNGLLTRQSHIDELIALLLRESRSLTAEPAH